MKKWTKILCCLCLCVFLLTGCATVKGFTNAEKEIIYTGSSAVRVGDYLYFGNSFADYSSFSSAKDYKTSAKVSYLSRVDVSGQLDAKDRDYSPAKVEKVSSKVSAHAKSFMFVLGKHIFYLTPNTQKVKDDEGNISNYFNYSTFYRSGLNGGSKKKLYTSTDEISQIEALKFDGKYYIVMLQGDKLLKMNLPSGKVTELASGVTSMALPKTYNKDEIGSSLDWNGEIFYTKNITDEDNPDVSGTQVMKISIADGVGKDVDPHMSGSLTFVGRVRDVVFFTRDSRLYMCDTNVEAASNSISTVAKDIYYTSGTISDVRGVFTQGSKLGETYVDGYLFKEDSSLVYYNKNSTNVISFVDKSSEEALTPASIVALTSTTLYFATDSAIYRTDLAKIEDLTASCTNVVTMSSIHNGLFAFDGSYVYFYAGLQTPPKNEDDETEVPTDSYEYFYRARVDGDSDYDLLSLTDVAGRRTTTK